MASHAYNYDGNRDYGFFIHGLPSGRMLDFDMQFVVKRIDVVPTMDYHFTL
ncbi:uncharacterized protein G2W53_018097 [Senna tora]|uniref:Uncharacterized protein n=1 Tax=Senna tora TaxID=362788 RepID=A0A834TQQ4_9FABA|nr:uncharacterized protein G2W53_018097 [Senna tora]